jgi:DNA mismatch repair protein MutS
VTGAHRFHDAHRASALRCKERRVNGFEPSQEEPFRSVLWRGADADVAIDGIGEPECFHDLNLDQVVAAVTAEHEHYNLAPFFYVRPRDADGVLYRQEVMRDLERVPLMQAIRAFAQSMQEMRARLDQSQKLFYQYEKERLFLGAVESYCTAAEGLAHALRQLEPESRGLRGMAAFLNAYVSSAEFVEVVSRVRGLILSLASIRYELILREGSITVREDHGEAEATAAVEETFAKFRRGAVKDYTAGFRTRIGVHGLNHIEAQVLDRVALLNPAPFAALDKFFAEHQQYLNCTIARFDREVQFYVAWLSFIAPLKMAGLEFCYPQVSNESKEIAVNNAFDVALAARLVKERAGVVRNDFYLWNTERILVVSGPNHGGKTTFARMFGQLHWLAGLGCPVAGTQAKLFLFDRLFTHFEKEEDIATLRGKLQDDLIRIHAILEQATFSSLIVMNEIFASTTLDDALWLGRQVMAELSHLDALALCVTFLTELASFDAKTVSMVAAIDPRDPAIRTFRIERRPADGLAYALAVAEKYRVTYDWLKRRIAA